MLALADLAAALCAATAVGVVDQSGAAGSLWAAALAPIWILIAKATGLYDADHVRIRHQTVDEIQRLFHWVTLSVGLTALLLASAPGHLVTARGAVAMWVVGFCASFVFRAGARALWRWLVPAELGLVLGEGQLADALRRKLALESGHHLSLVDGVELNQHANGDDPGGVLSMAERLPEIVERRGIERVILAVHDLDERTLSSVTATCRSLGVKLSVAPPLRAMLGTAVELSHLAELPLIEFRTWDPSRSSMALKRVTDVVVATAVLTVLSPLLALIAACVRLDSPGSALFRQRRAGQAGRPFSMLKFRTMVADAEARMTDLVPVDELAEPMFKLRDDPRVTRVGRFLRRWSLDELPQLVNVLKGEMSLVGPRPEELWLVERYGEAERFRLEMRPGMTGPMQIHGRGELTFQERLAVEREYVENYSLRKDLKILARTVSAVRDGRGAF
jgi:exopolysaccharide biosynthesis polyprenyl glycosylphosphotransferase